MLVPARILLSLLACCILQAQSPAEKLQFEVASIKPAAPPLIVPGGRMMTKTGRGAGGPGSSDPERYSAPNISLANLVALAYGIKDYQLSAPDWMQSTRFEVTAKVPKGATKEQFALMVRNLLQERFGLAVHHETKQLPLYDLLVAKNGPKMKETVEEPAAKDAAPAPPPPLPPPGGPMKQLEMDKDGFPIFPGSRGGRGGPTMIMMRGRARMQAVGQTMQQFADMLTNQMGKPVTDLTGLKGKYDFTLTWAPDNMPGGPMMPGGPGPGGPPPESADSPGPLPSLQSAVQEQLGLRLEAKRGAVDIIVVDHAERVPTEN